MNRIFTRTRAAVYMLYVYIDTFYLILRPLTLQNYLEKYKFIIIYILCFHENDSFAFLI